MDMTAELLAGKTKVVDLSADFRIKDKAVYEDWYKVKHNHANLIKESVYGIPELNASTIRRSRLVANPGCYPSSVILGLMPALRIDLIKSGNIIVDSKSGTSGAAGAPMFPPCSVKFTTHSAHTMLASTAILRKLNKKFLLFQKEHDGFFYSHLLPINRGILSTIYCNLCKGVDEARVRAAYEAGFRRHKWLRLMPEGNILSYVM
jgi:Acetylglutamate semialdehyde dehydrogenase